jgi:hypothetical protein
MDTGIMINRIRDEKEITEIYRKRGVQGKLISYKFFFVSFLFPSSLDPAPSSIT